MAYLHIEVQHPYGEVSQYMLKVNNKKDAFIHKFRKQYGVTDEGYLFKRDIEPPMYSFIKML